MAQTNPFLLAADNVPALLPLLRSEPALASAQDAHGYSLLHAAASYNHLDLLRALITEFGVDVNLKDEDGETCLFVAETVEAAKCLVEELHLDTSIKNDEDQTALDRISTDEDFPDVAEYLRLKSAMSTGGGAGEANGMRKDTNGQPEPAPPLPPNVKVDIGTMPEPQTNGEDGAQEPDPEFKRRIEELAARGDFYDEAGQRELRELVSDAVRGVSSDQRDVRRRFD